MGFRGSMMMVPSGRVYDTSFRLGFCRAAVRVGLFGFLGSIIIVPSGRLYEAPFKAGLLRA